MQAALVAEVLPLLQAGAHDVGAAFTTFAHTAAPLAVAALWQGTAVAVGLALCLRLAPRLSAAHRFSVWAGGFAVVVALQTLPLLFHPAAGSAANALANPGSDSAAQSIFARPLFEIDVRWTLAIAGLWLALSMLRAADLAIHTLRLRRLWKNARPIDALFAAWDYGRGPIPVCTTTELDRPSVIGFLAPRILIPDWLHARLTPGELEQVILHECEHLRRRDDWTNLLQKLALVLFPLNPALAWMEHQLCAEREMACDEGVVRVTHAPRAYAACLASMAERRLEQNGTRRTAASLSLGAFERRSELVRRVQSILWRKNLLGPVGARAVLGVLGCGLLVSAVELARSPQVVGFVSAPPVEAQDAPSQLIPRAGESPEHLVAMNTQNGSGFRATNAVAILPTPSQRPALNDSMPSSSAHNIFVKPLPASGSQAGADANAANMASIAPQPQWIQASAKRTDAESSSARQQWLVTATWEEAEKPAAVSHMVADYDAGPNASAGPIAKRAPQQIAVTQLILRVESAAANSGTPDGQPHADSNSILSRQAVLPLGNGWLVIQL